MLHCFLLHVTQSAISQAAESCFGEMLIHSPMPRQPAYRICQTFLVRPIRLHLAVIPWATWHASSQSICQPFELWLCMWQVTSKAVFLIHRSRGEKPRRMTQATRRLVLMHLATFPSTILWILSRAFWLPSTYSMATVKQHHIQVVGAKKPCTAIWPHPALDPTMIRRLFCRPSSLSWPSHKPGPGVFAPVQFEVKYHP